MPVEKYKRNSVWSSLLALLFLTACYQQFQSLTVKTTDEGIVFSHPKMEEAFDQKNLCIFGEINVRRQIAANNFEEMWSLQSTESGFQKSSEPMVKPYIIYGESLPQTSVKIISKPLAEGKYRINGVIGIYNEKRELVNDLSFANEFVLKKDDSGKLIVEK